MLDKPSPDVNRTLGLSAAAIFRRVPHPSAPNQRLGGAAESLIIGV